MTEDHTTDPPAAAASEVARAPSTMATTGAQETGPGADETASSSPVQAVAPEGAPAPREEELRNQLLRLAADFENYRKRAQRELEQVRRYGIERLLGDLLPLLDAVDRALGFVGDAREPFAEGVRLIGSQAVEILARHGVKSFSSIGQAFDPSRHEAMGTRSAPEAPPGVVLEEHQKGYLLHDRLLRAAKVVVSVALKDANSTPAGEQVH